MKPRVFTFFQQLPNFHRPQKLLNLWAESWQAGGFECKILSEEDARTHPGYQYFCERIVRFPTVNPPEYERACYLRHLAMANVGGGLLTDYDCILRKAGDFGTPFPDEPVCLEPTLVPCAVLADANGFEDICDMLCEFQPNGLKHVSDMAIFRRSEIHVHPRCVEHLDSGSSVIDDPGDGWKKAPIIHFSNFSFGKLGWKGDKADLITRVLKTLEPL